MSGVLYTKDILRLAASTGAFARLDHPDASAERRSQICGSRVTIDVKLGEDGQVIALGQEVRACALGQASAALMSASALGRSADELETIRDSFKSWLSGATDDPVNWPGLDIFEPARTHSARHPAIMLAFEAVAEAARAATPR